MTGLTEISSHESYKLSTFKALDIQPLFVILPGIHSDSQTATSVQLPESSCSSRAETVRKVS